MHGSVSSNKRIYATCDANECGAAEAFPIATIIEMSKDLLRGTIYRSKHPKRDQDAKEGKDVDDKNDGLDQRQLPCQHLAHVSNFFDVGIQRLGLGRHTVLNRIAHAETAIVSRVPCQRS